VQQLAQRVWILTEHETSHEVLNRSLEALLNDNAFGFQRDVENLTATQLNLCEHLSTELKVSPRLKR
jgi:hypothetical protein